ncbi:MAG: hypothetical protein HFI34_03085 [Lachnospiraceae bacterium]|nr:hypothetical protein [Lachnospiraceae bacterium]
MKLEIKNIYADGYERFAEVETYDKKNITVHFIEYNEYLNQKNKSELKKIGDVLDGNIRIDLVSNSYKIKDELMFSQSIENSSHIVAVIEVEEVVDDYSIHAKTSICDERILVEFENKMFYHCGDRVYVEGSLEID